MPVVINEDNSAIAERIRSLNANGRSFHVIERRPAFLSVRWLEATPKEASGYRLEFAG